MEGYRRLLEVSKWLSAKDILQLTTVSELWRKVLESAELWWELCRSARLLVPESEHPKLGFRRLHNSLQMLVIVRPTEVRCFNVRKRAWSEARRTAQQLQVDEFSSSLILPDGSVLCCGGSLGTPWKTAYRLTLLGEVERLHDMLIPRGGHGLAICKSSLYAFGGCGGNSAEALDWEPLDSVAGRAWSRIPNMLAVRCYFTPCTIEPLIYLCGGFADRCEVYKTETRTYSALAVSLPESSETSAVVSDWELVVLSPSYVSRLSLRQLGTLTSEKHAKWGGVWGSMSAVLHGEAAFSPFDAAIQVFDLRRLEKSLVKP